jgi:hypothetical protein
MDNESFEGSQLSIDEVKDRWDVEQTPVTGMPKKVRGAYVSWRNSSFYGALLTKSDLKKLKKWCEYQIEHFDDGDKEEIK